MTLVFYISGHGFGHASRDLAVINAIARQRPDIRIVVRSSVPRWFIEASAIGPVDLQEAQTDTGIVQVDSLRLDEDETARRAAAFYGTFNQRVRDEASVLRALDASIVVGDIPPLACAAAYEAGVPSVAFGNFTWDWVYLDYPRFEQLAPGAIDIIQRAYGTTTRALRLPFHGGFEPMIGVTCDIPLVARRARHTRDQVRRTLHLDPGRPVVLASFGGHGLGLPYEAIARQGRFTLVLTDYEATAGAPPDDVLRLLTVADLKARELGYEDLVAAADVVVSKPGYGIVSECIANGASLLYTSRGRFLEHDVFVAEMPEALRCRYIPQDDLLAGRWSEAVEALLSQPAVLRTLPLNGSQIAADEILRAMGLPDSKPTDT